VIPLTPEIRKRLHDFLAPLMAEERQRKALVKSALAGTSAFQRIDWAGNGYQFTAELIDSLADAQVEVMPGLSPLAALLEECREVVGLERQDEVDSLRRALRPRSSAPGADVSPFPGLEPFAEAQAPFFFGRTREVRNLVQMMAAPDGRFACVIGASGSGKSSLVAAGVIPALRQGAVPASRDWLVVRALPGKFSNPFLSVAFALDPFLEKVGYRPDAVARKLAGSEQDRQDVVSALLRERPESSEWLLFLDQMEELFTLVNPGMVAPFVAFLDATASHERVRIVGALRADFYPVCLAHEPLLRRLRGGSFPLGPPNALALYQMITEPAELAGLTFEPGLAERIVEDTGTAPGALALMAYALRELWRRRTGSTLTHQIYLDFGGVKGAVARRAGEVFDNLTESARAALPEVFRDLVTVSEDQTVTRVRAALDRFAASPGASELIDAFANWDARLLVKSASAGEAIVEVAHEALFSAWEPLASWIEQRKTDLEMRRRVELAAVDWERAARDPTHLWPHERLAPVHEALRRLGIEPTTLPEPTRSFLRPEAERLLEELELPKTTHYRRAEIGDRLDRIGDPRPGVGLRPDGVPDIVWCAVPGGTVTLREGAGTFEVERFFIAKYPVTCRQYKAFLDDPAGYRSKRWWANLWHEPQPGERYREVGNCPVENVSWYDAMAYCRWLSMRLGYEVQLPTEYQWQQAANGGEPTRGYPWGPDWVEGRANTAESRLSRSTTVGVYPRGASAQKGLDLAGNVWEWCLNRYRSASDVSVSSQDERVVRGGSWADVRDYSRCRYRYGCHPEDRSHRIGFRIVRLAYSTNESKP
jgi:hypothetical protein